MKSLWKQLKLQQCFFLKKIVSEFLFIKRFHIVTHFHAHLIFFFCKVRKFLHNPDNIIELALRLYKPQMHIFFILRIQWKSWIYCHWTALSATLILNFPFPLIRGIQISEWLHLMISECVIHPCDDIFLARRSIYECSMKIE